MADEEVMEAMNMAMSAETERINKFNFSGRTKPARVSALEMVSDEVKDKREEGRILAALKSVQSEMATMQAEMKTLRGEVTKAQKSSGGSKRGCADIRHYVMLLRTFQCLQVHCLGWKTLRILTSL